ncbi:PAS domain-containing protein [Roseobacter sp. HKCCA0434]|uniref:PAS domain-containing protein n=1 Tax=Roseobacter sp. HKCCA0434 TaxID=3079297 RepID=UPI0029058F33|nr:PAS domain-containing protein [Roseobacter sp. HKCCA0434]
MNANDLSRDLPIPLPEEPCSDADRAQIALAAGKMASFEWDIPSGTVHCCERLPHLFGLRTVRRNYPIDEFFAAIHPDDIPAIDAAVQRSIAEGCDYVMEWRVDHVTRGTRWIAGHGRIVERDADGRARRMLGVNWDITERREQEEALTRMAHEMDHRVGNCFAMMAGLVGIAARRAETPGQMSDMLRQQMVALRDAHDISKRLPDRFGEERNCIDLARLLSVVLRPWHSHAPDIDIPPGIEIRAEAGTNLAVMFYELATNAAKHGGLSDTGTGLKVTLDPSSDDGLTLVWQERSSCAVPRLHGAKGGGYGTLLLAQVARSIGAEMRREEAVGSMKLTLHLPASILVDVDAASRRPAAAPEAYGRQVATN